MVNSPRLVFVWIIVIVNLSCFDAETGVENLSRRFFDYQCEISPGYAAFVGKGVDDAFFDFSFANLERIKDRIEGFLDEATALEATSDTDTLTLNALTSLLQSFMDGYQYREYGLLNPLSFLDGIHMEHSYFTAQRVNRTSAQLDTLLLKYATFPNYIDTLTTLMKRAVELNRTNNAFSMAGVLEKFTSLVQSDYQSHPFYRPFDNPAQYSTDEDRQMYEERGKVSVENDIIPAYIKLRDTLLVYLNHLRPEIAISSLDGGADYYQALLEYYTSIPGITASQIHDIGLDAVAKIRRNMEQIQAEVGFTGTLEAFLLHVNEDDRFHVNSSDTLLSGYNEIVFERINPRLSRIIKSDPEYDLEIRPSPSEDALGGLYYRPDVNRTRPGVFEVNVFNPETKPTFEMLVLSLHEANPGHHLQITSSLAQESIPNFRRFGTAISNRWFAPLGFPSYTSYVEGWALYSEDLGFDMDLYADPYERLGRYSYDMLRACRLVVDTGMHALGWSRQRAIDYMSSQTTAPLHEMVVEIDRYITWPGQACAYKIGGIKMLELRSRAEAMLGAVFDLREFHDVILRTGAVPLSLLENTVETWIKEEQVKSCTALSTTSNIHGSYLCGEPGTLTAAQCYARACCYLHSLASTTSLCVKLF